MDKPKQYLDRLAALNGGPLRHQGDVESELAEIRRKLRKQRVEPQSEPQTPPAILYQRDIPNSQSKIPPPHRIYTQHITLEEAVDGTEVDTPFGKAFLIEKPAREILESNDSVCEEFCACLGKGEARVARRLAEIAGADPSRPEDLLFLDIETTGLSGVPLFLIGAMTWENGGLFIRQYLARDYAEEAAVTALFAEIAHQKRILASFNGKTFDLPYIRLRAAVNGVKYRLDHAHFDLLHEARRIWRGVLPDCKLQTLERHICGRSRSFDIPGYEIPEAYHAYVRSGNAAEIIRILEHNALDLVTMADLMARMG